MRHNGLRGAPARAFDEWSERKYDRDLLGQHVHDSGQSRARVQADDRPWQYPTTDGYAPKPARSEAPLAQPPSQIVATPKAMLHACLTEDRCRSGDAA